MTPHASPKSAPAKLMLAYTMRFKFPQTEYERGGHDMIKQNDREAKLKMKRHADALHISKPSNRQLDDRVLLLNKRENKLTPAPSSPDAQECSDDANPNVTPRSEPKSREPKSRETTCRQPKSREPKSRETTCRQPKSREPKSRATTSRETPSREMTPRAATSRETTSCETTPRATTSRERRYPVRLRQRPGHFE